MTGAYKAMAVSTGGRCAHTEVQIEDAQYLRLSGPLAEQFGTTFFSVVTTIRTGEN